MGELGNTNTMISEIKEILQTARFNVAQQVNSELLAAYWHIGKIIVEHEQGSNERAEYGKQTLKELSEALTNEFGGGINKRIWRRFFCFQYSIYAAILSKLSNSTDGVC